MSRIAFGNCARGVACALRARSCACACCLRYFVLVCASSLYFVLFSYCFTLFRVILRCFVLLVVFGGGALTELANEAER